MGNNCAPVTAYLFPDFYESQFVAKVFKDHSKYDPLHEFNNTFLYHDEILAVSNPNFEN